MSPDPTPSSCVLVLNFNGLEHLDACLSSAVRAAAAVAECRVVLVDNRSTDGSVAFTRQMALALHAATEERASRRAANA